MFLATQPIPNDALSPCITLPRPSKDYTGEKLDKLKANYKKWRNDADRFLTDCNLRGYIDGSIPHPGDVKPRACANWHANDEMAVAMLFMTLEESEGQFLDRSLGAKACWDALRVRHQNEGPFEQAIHLQEAFTTKFSRDTPLCTTAQQICATVQEAYSIGDIPCDLMKCIALLSGLTELEDCHSTLASIMSSLPKSFPVTSAGILQYLEQQQASMDSISKRTTASDPLAPSEHPQPAPADICINREGPGQRFIYRLQTCGGMAGKPIEDSKRERPDGHKAQNGGKTSSGKVSIKVQGTDGKNYNMLVDATQLTPYHPAPADTIGPVDTPVALAGDADILSNRNPYTTPHSYLSAFHDPGYVLIASKPQPFPPDLGAFKPPY